MNTKEHKAKVIIICLVLLSFLPSACSGNNSNVTYEFATVRRGTVERTVSSSGTIRPVSTVRILPQMSGKVEKIYVDFNDTVRRGEILAELNTDMLRLRREQQYSAVLIARANYELQLLNHNNQVILAERNLISEFELRTSRTNLENLAANLSAAENNLRVIDTEINQFAFITSPIDGIVLDRMINEGDSVSDSSSSGSASIFTLAENLSEMQIEASIGELDVASIYQGQAVRFTLESLPGRRFNGIVTNIRLVPAVVNNVVSYTVIIRAENPDGSLLPGMTCAVEFIVARNENTLLVSNAALRYQPTSLSAEEIDEKLFYADLDHMTEIQRTRAVEARNNAALSQASSSTQNERTGIVALLTGGGRNTRPRGTQAQARAVGDQEGVRYLWYINDNGTLDVIRVRIGIVTGTNTEIFVLESSVEAEGQSSYPGDIEGRQFISRERL